MNVGLSELKFCVNVSMLSFLVSFFSLNYVTYKDVVRMIIAVNNNSMLEDEGFLRILAPWIIMFLDSGPHDIFNFALGILLKSDNLYGVIPKFHSIS